MCVCVCKKDGQCYSNLKWSTKLVVRVSLFSFPQFDIVNAKFLWNLALRVPNSPRLLNRLNIYIYIYIFDKYPYKLKFQ